MMIFSLVAMIGLEKCCITSACLQWLCHSGEQTVARGPLVSSVNDIPPTSRFSSTLQGYIIGTHFRVVLILVTLASFSRSAQDKVCPIDMQILVGSISLELVVFHQACKDTSLEPASELKRFC